MHLDELELDVLLVVLKGTNDLCLVIIGGMSLKFGLDLSDLSLSLVWAAGNLLVQSLENGDQFTDAVHDVIVVCGENRADSRFEARQEVVIVRDAVRDLVTILLSSE